MAVVRKKKTPSRRETSAKKAHLEEILEEGLLEKFPGSDAVAIVEPVHHDTDRKPKHKSSR